VGINLDALIMKILHGKNSSDSLTTTIIGKNSKREVPVLRVKGKISYLES